MKEVPEDEGDGGQEGEDKKKVNKMLSKAPNKGFEGAEYKGSRNTPVEFEKHVNIYCAKFVLC